MARKKKEEIKEQPEAVVTEPALEQETPKKTVKRARTTKKPSSKQTKETVQTETVENASSVEETAHKQNEEKTVETVEKIEKPQKPKRVKKPVTKEKATVTVDDKTEKGTAPIAPAPVATETKEEVKKTVTRAEKNETIKLLVKE